MNERVFSDSYFNENQSTLKLKGYLTVFKGSDGFMSTITKPEFYRPDHQRNGNSKKQSELI